MNVQLLIDSIVRQITVLVAQLATSGGVRAPVAHVANQVFLDLANELAAQGVSRKVSADMFGMALRAYLRKIRRLEEAQSERGRTLWQAVFEFIKRDPLVTRDRVLERFKLDGEIEVNAILHDLTESGLVFSSGTGKGMVYRTASDEELGRLSEVREREGLDEFVWVIAFRQGPISQEKVAELVRRSVEEVRDVVTRLADSGRVQRTEDGRISATDFLIEPGSTAGWEAAVFDHFQAVVRTISQRLSGTVDEGTSVGGSTYTLDIWPGHPMEHEVKTLLEELRQRCGAVRRRLDVYNAGHPSPSTYQQITTYLGQCAIEREREN